jgi:hypothetical protein
MRGKEAEVFPADLKRSKTQIKQIANIKLGKNYFGAIKSLFSCIPVTNGDDVLVF